tara:strand:+ start:997 stop:1257 length:261 start_codon:yes stop_codon:yes gene_type:complete
MSTQHEKLGPTGRYRETHRYIGGELYLTGSMYGFGPTLVVTANASASFSDGGQLNLKDINTGEILDFSLSYISGSAGNSNIYFFKK